MSNGYFNNQTRPGLKGGKGTSGFMDGGGGVMKSPSFKQKPGFAESAQGNKQPTDRSSGAPRAKIHPNSDGI